MDVLQKIAIMTTLRELIFEEIQFREFYKFWQVSNFRKN